MDKSKSILIICFLLLGLGLVVSGYLLARTFALAGGQQTYAIDVCSALFGSGCDETLINVSSWKLGLPLAGWGIVYYGTLTCLLLLALVLKELFAREATLLALLLSLVGAVSSAWLTLSFFTGKVPLCPLCLLVHGVNLALFVVWWRLADRSVREVRADVRAAAAFLVAEPDQVSPVTRWKPVGVVVPILVAVLMYQWVLIQSERRGALSELAFDPAHILEEFDAAHRRDLKVRTDDPCIGPADAIVQLVVFSNFQCPGCSVAAKLLDDLAGEFTEDLSVVFKHYPLSTKCNAGVLRDVHPHSCDAAWASEAARRQGKFWDFHDQVFEADLNAEGVVIRQIAMAAGIQMASFEVDRNAPETLIRIEEDIEIASAAGVQSTPAVFINEKRISHMTRRAIRTIIVSEIAADGELE